jgi:excisionase family DNA binding protein
MSKFASRLNLGDESMFKEIDEVRGASKTSAFTNSDAATQIPKRLLSKRELATILSVSQRTVENWLSRKMIPCLRLSPRLTRFSLAKVEAALARYEIKEVGAQR